MTNRCSAYLAALEAEAATFQLLAIGKWSVIEVCRTNSRDDAVWEIRDMLLEPEKTRAMFPGAEFLVVLDTHGKQVSPWFEVPVSQPSIEAPKPVAPPAPPQPWDFAGLFAWSLVVAGVVMFGYWLGSQ